MLCSIYCNAVFLLPALFAALSCLREVVLLTMIRYHAIQYRTVSWFYHVWIASDKIKYV